MGLSILSQNEMNLKEILSGVTMASIEANLNLFISESAKTTSGRIEVEIKKMYEEEEYLSIDIIPKREQVEMNKPGLLNINYQGHNYFMIAGISDAYYQHIIYDLSLSYLRLNPTKIISVYEEIFVTLENINKVEEKTGYYLGWMKELKKEC